MVWMNKQLTYFDFFSGIGGFRLGLERAGFKCVGYCDNDEYANKLYRNYFDTTHEVFFDDITTINTKELPDFDILCAGSLAHSVAKAEPLELLKNPQVVLVNLKQMLWIKLMRFINVLIKL